MISKIKQEVEAHDISVTELKRKLEKLVTSAFSELLKIKDLREIIESLKSNGIPSNPGQPSSSDQNDLHPPAVSEENQAGWKRELDRELEKLLVIKKLLESSLPIPKENPPANRPDSAPGTKKILVVDDDPTTLKIITHFLAQENYSVSTSQSGIEGLKKAFRENPDLIILDVMMSDLNGFQFLSLVKKDGEKARLPVIILSSLAEEADILKGLEIGATDYLTKPFSPQVLLAKVKKIVDPRP